MVGLQWEGGHFINDESIIIKKKHKFDKQLNINNYKICLPEIGGSSENFHGLDLVFNLSGIASRNRETVLGGASQNAVEVITS